MLQYLWLSVQVLVFFWEGCGEECWCEFGVFVQVMLWHRASFCRSRSSPAWWDWRQSSLEFIICVCSGVTLLLPPLLLRWSLGSLCFLLWGTDIFSPLVLGLVRLETFKRAVRPGFYFLNCFFLCGDGGNEKFLINCSQWLVSAYVILTVLVFFSCLVCTACCVECTAWFLILTG